MRITATNKAEAIKQLKDIGAGTRSPIYIVHRARSRSGLTVTAQVFCISTGTSPYLFAIGLALCKALDLEYEEVQHGGGVVFRGGGHDRPDVGRQMNRLAALLGVPFDDLNWEWL